MGSGPGVPTTDVQTAARRLTEASPPMLVDVREPDEFRTVRVVGSVLVPLSTFMQACEQLPRDVPLLMLCAAGSRSAAATAPARGPSLPPRSRPPP